MPEKFERREEHKLEDDLTPDWLCCPSPPATLNFLIFIFTTFLLLRY